MGISARAYAPSSPYAEPGFGNVAASSASTIKGVATIGHQISGVATVRQLVAGDAIITTNVKGVVDILGITNGDAIVAQTVTGTAIIYGPLTATPINVVVGDPSDSPTIVALSEDEYTGVYTIRSAPNSSIATATITGSSLSVQGVGHGQTLIAVVDDRGNQVSVAVTVNLRPGPIVLSVLSLSCTVDGTSVSTFSVSQSQQGSPWTVSVADPTIASASISGSTVSVLGLKVGSTKITVSDGGTQSTTIPVLCFGALIARETSAPNSQVGMVSVYEEGYTGLFTFTLDDLTEASLSVPTARGPGPFNLLVTPVTPGLATELHVSDDRGNRVDLIVTTANLDLGTLFYNFLDNGGINPLPPGVLVSIYPIGVQQTPSTLVAQGYTLLGGRIELDLLESTQYIATFIGNEAPIQSLAFTSPSSPTAPASQFTYNVTGYTSPVKSTVGWALEILDKTPRKWLTEEAKQPGGNAYNLAIGLGAILSAIDVQGQTVLASLRLYTSEGPQLDSFARDFFGDTLPRYVGESDDLYRSRIIVALQGTNCTLQSIQTKVQAYIDATPTAQQGTVLCFDLQSNPAFAAQVGIVDGGGQFCVLLPTTRNSSLAFFAGRSYAARNSYVIRIDQIVIATSVDPHIIDIVNRAKSAGFKPIYAQLQA